MKHTITIAPVTGPEVIWATTTDYKKASDLFASAQNKVNRSMRLLYARINTLPEETDNQRLDQLADSLEWLADKLEQVDINKASILRDALDTIQEL